MIKTAAELALIQQQYRETLQARKALIPDRYKHSMPSAEVETPTFKVGDKAFVVHSYTHICYNDLTCGDTTVTKIKSNGTIVLANGFEFRKTGYGLAKNSACVVQNKPAHPWNAYDVSSVECHQILDACRLVEQEF